MAAMPIYCKNSLKIFFSGTGVTVYLDSLGSLTPGGQATPGYLDPHPGYLDPHHFFLLKPIKIQNVIYIIKRQVKENCHCELIKKFFRINALGWGSSNPVRGILTPTHLFVTKSSTNIICYQKLLQYFMLFLK